IRPRIRRIPHRGLQEMSARRPAGPRRRSSPHRVVMLRYHMALATRDSALRPATKRPTTAAGATAAFAPDSAQPSPSRQVDLAIFDARGEAPDRRFYSLLPRTARIRLIVPGDDLVDRVPLLADPRVTSLFCHDDRFDDDEFISSATKALR